MTPRRDGLDRAVRERRDRRERGRRDRSLAKSLAIAGALGWTIVLPALAGVAAGRWLDRELHSGIVFTAALLFAGIALGCALAWRRVRA
jgi:ATP synthase protein I